MTVKMKSSRLITNVSLSQAIRGMQECSLSYNDAWLLGLLLCREREHIRSFVGAIRQRDKCVKKCKCKLISMCLQKRVIFAGLILIYKISFDRWVN